MRSFDASHSRQASTLREVAVALRLLGEGADREVIWRGVLAIALTIAGGLLSGLAPLALKGIVDGATGSGAALLGASLLSAPGSTPSPAAYAIAYVGALCGARLLSDFRPLLVGVAEQRLYRHVKRRYFAHLLDLPLSFHVARPNGAITGSLNQALSGYQVVAYHAINSLLPAVVELGTVAWVLATVVPPMLLTSFAAAATGYLAALIVCAVHVGGSADRLCMASNAEQGMLTDSLANCEAIKCFTAERATRSRYAALTASLEQGWRDLHRDRTRVALALTGAFSLAMATCFSVALYATHQGTLSVGGLVLASVYMLKVVQPLEMLGSALRDLSQARSFLRPMLAILQEPIEMNRSQRSLDFMSADLTMPALRQATSSRGTVLTEEDRIAVERIDRSNGSGSSSPIAATAMATNSSRTGPENAASISFFNVGFSYNDQEPVLQAFDLDIAPGRNTAIVGVSGSGKSSLVRLLLRLYHPQSGRILLDGTSIDARPVDELRALIGLVPQETALFHNTIAYNIGVGLPGIRQQDIEEAVDLAGLHDVIRRLPDGYDTVVGERGLRLSGGERQRIAIARAVLKRPRVYVFDEATSMLDTQTERKILRNLRAISSGCTTITIAHRLSTIRHADRIVVLDRGRIVEQGEHETLLAQAGAYARLWEAQQTGEQTGVVGAAHGNRRATTRSLH